jgi:hypothetical protein
MTFDISGGSLSGMEKKLGMGNSLGIRLESALGLEIFNMIRQAME